MAVPRTRGDADFAGVGELDGITDEVEQHLRKALFVSEANRERLVHGRSERELLVLGERLGGRAHSLDHTLDRIFGGRRADRIGMALKAKPEDASGP